MARSKTRVIGDELHRLIEVVCVDFALRGQNLEGIEQGEREARRTREALLVFPRASYRGSVAGFACRVASSRFASWVRLGSVERCSGMFIEAVVDEPVSGGASDVAAGLTNTPDVVFSGVARRRRISSIPWC